MLAAAGIITLPLSSSYSKSASSLLTQPWHTCSFLHASVSFCLLPAEGIGTIDCCQVVLSELHILPCRCWQGADC